MKSNYTRRINLWSMAFVLSVLVGICTSAAVLWITHNPDSAIALVFVPQ